jgi:hypothetical protein
VHALEPGAAAQPTLQALHTALPAEPTDVLNVPAGHSEHSAASGPAYEPAKHCVQDEEPSGAAYPMLHGEHEVAPLATSVAWPDAHAAQDAVPALGANWPDGHGRHAAALVASACSLYVPLGHFWHVARSVDTNVPAAHSVHTLEPGAAAQPTAHATHDELPATPAFGPYVPAGHCTHDDDAASAYVPAAHCVQNTEPAAAA